MEAPLMKQDEIFPLPCRKCCIIHFRCGLLTVRFDGEGGNVIGISRKIDSSNCAAIHRLNGMIFCMIFYHSQLKRLSACNRSMSEDRNE